MKMQNKSLFIHKDSQSNNTTSVVVDEENVVTKTKEFLKKIAEAHKQAAVEVYKPLGVVLKAEDKKYSAVAYEKEKFVIVIPNGTTTLAKLYGNWNEAIVCAKRVLVPKKSQQKKTRIVLAEYTQ